MSTSITATQYSSYPNGFPGGVLIRDILQIDETPSRVFWVGNNPVLQAGEIAASNGNEGSFYQPFSTIDYAIGQCEANNNNIIFVREGHTETITAASAITCDVAGVYIVGLGQGSNRPTLTFSTATSASVVISAANVTIKNILGVAGIDGLTNPFHVQAANCTLDIEWQDASSAVEAATVILTTAAADNLKINLKYIGFPAGNAAVKAIGLVGVNNANIVVDVYGIFSTSIIQFLTTACTNIEIGGYFYNSGTTNFSKNVVDTVGGSTWFCAGFDGAAGSSFSGGSGAALAGDDISTVISNQAVPSADSTANALERDVIGNKADAAATGSVSSTESLMAYAKQNVTNTEKIGTITNTGGTASIGAILGDFANTTLISKLTTLQAGVSQFVSKSYADLTGYDTAAAFTVTGDVKVRVYGVVGSTAITSTSGTTTLSVGTTENAGGIIAATTIDNSDFNATDVWVDNDPATDCETLASAWTVIGGGADIILTRNVDDITAGSLTLYCEWIPLSSGATVVAA